MAFSDHTAAPGSNSPGPFFLTDCVYDDSARDRRGTQSCIGILPGEGIGPELVDCALEVLSALESATGRTFERVVGGAIGSTAELVHGTPLPDEIADFCETMFARGAPILAGPGGGRFVYELRARFDLFCKFAPLQTSPTLARANRLKSDHVAGLDILIVRENTGGVYQGRWATSRRPSGSAYAEHTFGYGEDEIRRIVTVSARAAAQRRGELAVIIKDGGIPTLSALWRDCALAIAADFGVHATFINIDLAAYQLVQEPRRFDVIVCPNLFGDVLADLGAVLIGSRGLSYSGNFSTCGRAVFQTNHGAGHDLTGRGIANPVAQILSLAMMLRESLGLSREAAWIERAVESVWAEGWRTFDLPEAGGTSIGTRDLTARIADALGRLATTTSG